MKMFMDAKRAFQDRAVRYLHAEIEGLYNTVEAELFSKHDSSDTLLKSLTER
jgi:hypothetical protein